MLRTVEEARTNQSVREQLSSTFQQILDVLQILFVVRLYPR
jgi:hypothetical protein